MKDQTDLPPWTVFELPPPPPPPPPPPLPLPRPLSPLPSPGGRCCGGNYCGDQTLLDCQALLLLLLLLLLLRCHCHCCASQLLCAANEFAKTQSLGC